MTVGMSGKEPDPRQVYADIIDLPHHVSDHHPAMSLYDRAAQFAPFAALSGYDDLIREEGRLVGRRIELSESELEQLNHRLARIASAIRGGTRPIAEITYFIPDPFKAGGRYETVTERIRKVDSVGQVVIVERKTGPSGSWMRIPIADILELRGENL